MYLDHSVSSEYTFFMSLTGSNWCLKHTVSGKIKICLLIAFLISCVMPFIGQRSYNALLMFTFILIKAVPTMV